MKVGKQPLVYERPCRMPLGFGLRPRVNNVAFLPLFPKPRLLVLEE